MTQLTQGSDMELREILDKYGLCKCGRHKDSKNFAYHICIEQGLLFDLLAHEQRSIDRAVAERFREIVNFALPDELPAGVDTICASILINTIMERAEQQLSPTTTEDKEVK